MEEFETTHCELDDPVPCSSCCDYVCGDVFVLVGSEESFLICFECATKLGKAAEQASGRKLTAEETKAYFDGPKFWHPEKTTNE